ncbi:hypothetical protein L1987_60945 [Smallanthus sonchifolius]|uniref:Uncharacterized protein n=1 Tax=Smallanthus sonchifolius TaxID=185202 RepID=A0ACB9D9E4_9ASTR|nr:hypothetical protein L1987_60945 [Smallanthus sonchifolius]
MQQQLQSSAERAEVRKQMCRIDQQQPAPEMELNHRPKSWKVQVVYYLCRNRQLEHPHFIEVALVSPDGLYLRDVIEKFSSLRGRGMASMYSWSCKRSYKNAFVWNDLCEDDLIIPAHENEYVLKGSEIVEENNSVRFAPDDDGYHSLTTYKIYKCIHRLADASTQTDEHVKVQESCRRSFLTDNGAVESSTNDSRTSKYGACSSAGKTDTLESLMKVEDNSLNTSEKLEEQEQQEEAIYQVPTNTKFKASNMLLHLISCGSNSSQDHDFCQSLSYRSRSIDSKLSSSLSSSSAMLGELDCLSENPRFSGSSVEAKLPKKEETSSLNQSSFYNANRINKCASTLTCTKCIPRSIIGSLNKHPSSSSVRFSEGPDSCILSPFISNNGSKQIKVAFLPKKTSKRIESSRDNKENVIKIEERLASGAGVIIHLESNDRPLFTR